MTLIEKYNKLGNAICPICGTAICLKNSCKSDYHKYYLELQIFNSNIMQKSKKFTLNGNDFLKGFVVSILTAILTATYSAIQTGGLGSIDFKLIATTTVLSALGYLTKNLTENHEGKILKK